MYGLVFEIVEEWVIEKQGIDVWHSIKHKAKCNVKDQGFLRRSYYPDEELVDIIVAGSEVLGVSVDGILEAFGHYVIRHHFANGYDDLLRCQGSTLRTWLSNLNAMHDHVQKSFPGENFIAPIFWCEDCETVPGSILLHYYTLRGTLLVPMVVGIVEELADYHFNVEVKMHQLALQDQEGASFTTWRITAVDATQQWKLSPKGRDGEPLVEEEKVNFDNVKLPGKCPFSGKKLRDTTKDTEDSSSTGEASISKCPFSSKTESSSSALSRRTSQTSLATSTNDQSIGLTLQKMKAVFPFHILVQRDFTVLQVGNSLPSLLGINEPDFLGGHIQDFLEISRPVLGSSWDWKALSKLADQHFFLAPRSHSSTLHRRVSMEDSSIKFKGSMITISNDTVMFVLVPDARNVLELRNMGLTLSDLPLESCQRDTIYLGEYITQEVDKAHQLDKLSKKLSNEKNLSNTLLYNMLPKQVADSLRSGQTVEPTFHENVTLFFSDIEGFTSICDQVDPWDVIDMLNQLYSVMDFLATHFNLYKVETIGDAYMCCSGLPEPDEYHAENIANFALAVVECVKHIKSPADGLPLNLRVGIHTGSCTSGVVGTLTPHYCLFGDMVNTTARHESTGIAGKIHCSSVLFGRLKHFSKFGDREQYSFSPRGLVEMKGKSDCYTYWLENGTDENSRAGPTALTMLSKKVEDMLAKKKWKMRRYFRRNGNLRDETGSVATTLTASSGKSSITAGSERTPVEQQQQEEEDHQHPQHPEYTEYPTNGAEEDNSSKVSDHSAHFDDDYNQDIDDMLDFLDEQNLQESDSDIEVWSKLHFDDNLKLEELVLKAHDRISSALTECGLDPPNLEIAKSQMLDFIQHVSTMYRDENKFHSFRRACHVLLCADYLWQKVQLTGGQDESSANMNVYDDPWDRVIVLFAALIHDMQHSGVSNEQLRTENDSVFQKYNDRGSYQERQALATSFWILEDDYPELYEELVFGCPQFSHHVEKLVVATDFENNSLFQKRLRHMERSLKGDVGTCKRAAEKRRHFAMELVLGLADVAHYSQDSNRFLTWNQLQFLENLDAHWSNRGADPYNTWHSSQLDFFHEKISPLLAVAEVVLPISSNLNENIQNNMDLWKGSGSHWLEASRLPNAKIEDSLCGLSTSERLNHLIDVNVEALEELLRDVVASHQTDNRYTKNDDSSIEAIEKPFDKMKSFISIKEASPEAKRRASEPSFGLSEDVKRELRDFASTVAAGYRNNQFHNLEHASHVAMLSNILLKNIDTGGFGVASDPLARFAVVFSALVHDIGHTGVTNGQLAEENPNLAGKYDHKSIAEQNSIDTAWGILMTDQYKNLQASIFDSNEECERFHQLLTNCVMATDIFDKDLKSFRNERWEQAFSHVAFPDNNEQNEEAFRKATIVIEHIIQASDVAHTMQSWDLYRKWNERLFMESYGAFVDGRADKDPSEGWYKGELWFFDNWVIPLTQKLKECGVFGLVSHQCIAQAKQNRLKWEREGEKICQVMLDKIQKERSGMEDSSSKPPLLLSTSSHFSESPSTMSASKKMLTSSIVNEVESMSKAVRRYEKKMAASCKSLIAVAYNREPDVEELSRSSVHDVHRRLRKQPWYRQCSEADFSDDEKDEDEDGIDASQKSGTRRVESIIDKALVLVEDFSSVGDVSAEVEDGALKLTTEGKKYLSVDGSTHGLLGRVLTSISCSDTTTAAATISMTKQRWSTIAHMTQCNQSKEVCDRLDDLISFSLNIGLVEMEG